MQLTNQKGFVQVRGDPHPWPSDSKALNSSCAVIIIDMQHDYCSPGFYLDKAGYDTKPLREPIEPIQRVLSVARNNGLRIIYTRQGRVPSTAESKSDNSSFPQTAMKGEEGWEIISELSPRETDIIIDKTTCSAFVSGELDRNLKDKRIKHLIFCGNTIDVCVHSTLRSAVDLGYDCMLLSDCCGAVNEGLHKWS